MLRDPAAPPRGLSVGLFGGSFDPPHEGHRLVVETAMRRTRLKRLWVLVTPGNPLKPRPPADLERRIAACRALMAGIPGVTVTGVEERLGARYSADTLAHLRRLYPRTRFVWIMGADNLAQFHKWEDWAWILENFPLAVVARPQSVVKAGLSPAVRRYARARLSEEEAPLLPFLEAPAWVLLARGPTSRLSSTALRAAGSWP
ncbi:nicotinate-nucleotide adenylyltransferase [Neomegalonema sp.]|uniref:nicotinate-nucleotide adenylyltransferase n=1 Tax=Neomegalonema sp. TaxID=2039713 RepID=UPI00261B8E53|nr:nicotinate-nucleotide adenylyltransferase [Neomegalonema sp.]MDD2867051.1 nicotinate-nucleotide adenylyltransferase [Neomegalonema sp.]